MNSPSWETVRGIAADVFNVPRESLSPASSPQDIESWDSVQHLNLVLAIEEQFELEIDPEEFEKMNSLGAVSMLVDGKLAS